MSVFDQTTANSTQQASNTSQQANTGASTTAQNNTYTADQQGVQGNAATTANDLLTGSIAQYMPTPSMTDYANYEFQQMAPQIANQYGSGSNQIPAQMQALMLGLTAQGQQNAYVNGTNALNAASNYALTPTGQTGTQTQASAATGSGTANQTTAQTGTDLDYGGLLDLLGFGLAGSGSTFPTTTTSSFP